MTAQPSIVGSMTLKALLEVPSLKNPPIIGLSGDGQANKKDVDQPLYNYGSAFLGPNLWDRSVDNIDFNLEYMDLDEFLSENGIPITCDDGLVDMPQPVVNKCEESSSCGLNVASLLPTSPCQFTPTPHQYIKSSPPTPPADFGITVPPQLSPNKPPSPVVNLAVDFKISEQDLALTSITGDKSFDPRQRNFSEEELKPQPIIKKSKKIYVPDDLKDEKYWARRHKNNYAARRSRDARRVKENQIALRAAFLEKENSCLRDAVSKLQKENTNLKERMAKYEGPVSGVRQ